MSSVDVKMSDSKPAAAKKSTNNTIPWVEKYRPETLDDVVGNEETLVRLRAIAEDGNMPNLILSGPPGTGKVNIMSMDDMNGCIYNLMAN
jgi:replication factor C subunit 2/4